MFDLKFTKLDKKGGFDFPYYWTAWCIILDHCAVEGRLKYDDLDERDIIFDRLKLSASEVGDILTDLDIADLIEWDEDNGSGSVMAKNWEKYQSVELSTERVKNHRASKEKEDQVTRIIEEFNKIVGSSYSSKTEGTRKLIRGRLDEGRTERELLMVVEYKKKDWSRDPRMKKYIRPNTLFRPGNFDNYINEIPKKVVEAGNDGSLVKVRDLYGTVTQVTQEDFDKAEKGFYHKID